MGGTLKETAEEIDSRGGKGVPVVCDHSKDDQVKAVFDRIIKEQGKLDVLVNNAYSAVNVSTDDPTSFKRFGYFHRHIIILYDYIIIIHIIINHV